MNTLRTEGDSDVIMWDDVLRAYAAALDEHRAFLLSAQPEGLEAGFDLVPIEFAPPASMPPLPAEFAERTRSLVAETEGLKELARDLLRRHQPQASPSRAAVGSFSAASRWDGRL